MLTLASTGSGAGWTSILLDAELALGSGAETMGAIGAGAAASDGGDASSSAKGADEGERWEREGMVAAGRVWVVRGRGGGGEAGRAWAGIGGGGEATGIVCEERAELGRGGGRLGGAAEVRLPVLGGASLVRTGSDTGAGVASINSRSLLSSSSASASTDGTVTLADPSSLWGLLAISSSCAPVMFSFGRGHLRLTRRADWTTSSGSQRSSASSSP